MQKAILLLWFIVFYQSSFGQQHDPTIRASSPKVDIRVGEDYYLKGGWVLEPGKNPDVFTIGSKWLYKTKKVSFITDIDSISFDVEAGHKYNFTVLLNQTSICNIQIVAAADPVFMNMPAMIGILSGIIIVFLVLYFSRKRISPRTLIRFGYVTVISFWLMTFVSGGIHGNYNHLRNVISELGALGTRAELFTSTALLFIALTGILFSFGFYRICRERKISAIPAILSFTTPITMIWASIFALGNEFHGSTGPLPFLVVIASLLAFILWRKDKDLSGARKLSLLCCWVMLLILTRFIKPFGIEYEGLVQRFYYSGWSIWTTSIAYYLSKYSRQRQL